MYYSKYYNKMPFPVRFRKSWEAGNPAVELQSGNIIEGPAEMLSQYNFLAPLPFEFHKIESITQDAAFTFIDEKIVDIQTTEPELVTKKEEPAKEEPAKEETPPQSSLADETPPQDNQTKIDEMPFDIKTVNWLAVKIEELEKACAFYKIDTTTTHGMNKKDKKWALVKLVKNAAGML